MSDAFERVRAALAGRYAVEKEIGRGAMATVYRALDVRHARPVAIKVLQAGHLAESPARFLQEIRIAAQLAHPHILPLHDSGEIHDDSSAGALLYYVMPYVEGSSLREQLRAAGRLDVGPALAIASTVAGALDHAHRHNVVHRDVKPENILLQAGEAVVADFGVARAIQQAAAETQTLPGLAVGTPAYMSPEQASGDESVDGRSDQYALACVVFEMLTGQPPFSGSGARATLMRHLQEAVPPVRSLRAEIPEPVEQALTRALAKQPAARFASMADFAAALQSSGSDAALPAVEAGPAARSIAVLPFTNSSSDPDNEYFSDGMTDELIHLLAQVDGLEVASRTSVFALRSQRLDVRALGERLRVGVVLEGTVRKQGPRLRITAQLTDVVQGKLLWSQRYDRSDTDVFAIQEELARTIVATLRADLLGGLGDPVPRRYTSNLAAYNLYLRGRHSWNKRTQAGVAEAIVFFEQAMQLDPAYALAYTGLSDAYALHLDYRASPVHDAMQRARAMALKALELDDTLAEAHTSLGWVIFIHDWDWAAAEREFRRAIELNPRYATAHQWYSWYLAAMGRPEEAIAEGRRARQLDPASLSIERSMGWLYYYTGQPARALPHLERALIMNPEATETLAILAAARLRLGDLAGAEQAVHAALALDPRDTATWAVHAKVAMARGDSAAASEAKTQLQVIARDRYVSPTDRAKVMLALGELDAAFAALEDAYAERRGWMAYLRTDPLLDGVRDDPRLELLIQRLRLLEA